MLYVIVREETKRQLLRTGKRTVSFEEKIKE